MSSSRNHPTYLAQGIVNVENNQQIKWVASLVFIELAKKGEVYDLIDAYYLKGLVFEKQKDYSKAFEYYEKGFSIIPEEVINKADFKEDLIRMKELISH